MDYLLKNILRIHYYSLLRKYPFSLFFLAVKLRYLLGKSINLLFYILFYFIVCFFFIRIIPIYILICNKKIKIFNPNIHMLTSSVNNIYLLKLKICIYLPIILFYSYYNFSVWLFPYTIRPNHIITLKRRMYNPSFIRIHWF